MNRQGTRALVVVALALIGLGGCCGTSDYLVTEQPVKQTIVLDVVVLGVTSDLWEELTRYDDAVPAQEQFDAHTLRLEHLLMKTNPEEITEHIMQARITTFDGEPATATVQDKGGKRTATCLVTPTVMEDDGSVRVAIDLKIKDKTMVIRIVDGDTQWEKPDPLVGTIELNMNSPRLTAGKPMLLGGNSFGGMRNTITLVRAEIVPAVSVPTLTVSAKD